MSLASELRHSEAEEVEGFRRDGGEFAGLAKLLLALSVVAGGLVVGRFVAEAAQLHTLPWVLARALGTTSLVSLTGLVTWGMWIRHPWRRFVHLRPATVTRVHVSLAVATLTGVVGHAAALAVDPYVQVGWLGALVPFAAGYRSSSVALGVLALYGLLVIGLSARLAGSWIGRSWRQVHRFALLVFWVAWLHGVTVGTDTSAMSWLYVASGTVVVACWVSKRVSGGSPVVERRAR